MQKFQTMFTSQWNAQNGDTLNNVQIKVLNIKTFHVDSGILFNKH